MCNLCILPANTFCYVWKCTSKTVVREIPELKTGRSLILYRLMSGTRKQPQRFRSLQRQFSCFANFLSLFPPSGGFMIPAPFFFPNHQKDAELFFRGHFFFFFWYSLIHDRNQLWWCVCLWLLHFYSNGIVLKCIDDINNYYLKGAHCIEVILTGESTQVSKDYFFFLVTLHIFKVS